MQKFFCHFKSSQCRLNPLTIIMLVQFIRNFTRITHSQMFLSCQILLYNQVLQSSLRPDGNNMPSLTEQLILITI